MASLEWHKAYRNAHKEQYKAYHRKPRAIAIKSFNGMRDRVKGNGNKDHLYKGLPILERQEFLDWILPNPEFIRLYKEWEQSGYVRNLRPSVNRIDSKLGYTLDNMEIITFGKNCILGNNSKKGTKYKQLKEK